MQRVHDRGGMPGGPINREQHQLADWELLAEGLSLTLGDKGIRCTDESRRTQEDLPPGVYESLAYYERWALGAELILVEKGLLNQEEVDREVAALDAQWGEGVPHGADGADAEHPGTHGDAPPNPYGQRIQAIAALLEAKGVLTPDEVRRQIAAQEARTPADGARLVARAWVDPAFKARLLADSQAACAELGIDASAIPHFVVLENRDKVHHVVVCTLCSCYPRPILGRPPDWYKSFNYRSRVVVEPRAVMREFGYEPDPGVEVRVHDSTADVRYLVLPRRPAGTEHLSEPELAQLVTRDSMIGVAPALATPVAVA